MVATETQTSLEHGWRRIDFDIDSESTIDDPERPPTPRWFHLWRGPRSKGRRMDNELIERVSRLYAAIGAVVETDLSNLKGQVVETDKSVGLYNDFRGGMSDAELSNLAHSLINNIANLPNHLKRWAARNGKDRTVVDETFSQSFALKIIEDLSNNDSHGEIIRSGEYGHSGKRPKLVEINRVLQLSPGSDVGSSVAMTFDTDGTPKVSGSGSAKAVITGTIVDEDENKIGELSDFTQEAVEDLERLLQELQAS